MKLKKCSLINLSFDLLEKGNKKDENVYSALGQTDSGRYVVVIFIHKYKNLALILSERYG